MPSLLFIRYAAISADTPPSLLLYFSALSPSIPPFLLRFSPPLLSLIFFAAFSAPLMPAMRHYDAAIARHCCCPLLILPLYAADACHAATHVFRRAAFDCFVFEAVLVAACRCRLFRRCHLRYSRADAAAAADFFFDFLPPCLCAYARALRREALKCAAQICSAKKYSAVRRSVSASTDARDDAHAFIARCGNAAHMRQRRDDMR